MSKSDSFRTASESIPSQASLKKTFMDKLNKYKESGMQTAVRLQDGDGPNYKEYKIKGDKMVGPGGELPLFVQDTIRVPGARKDTTKAKKIWRTDLPAGTKLVKRTISKGKGKGKGKAGSLSPVSKDFDDVLNKVISGHYSTASEVEKSFKRSKINGSMVKEQGFANSRIKKVLKPSNKTEVGKLLGTAIPKISEKLIEIFGGGYKSKSSSRGSGPSKVVKAKVSRFVKKNCNEKLESMHISGSAVIYKKIKLSKTDLGKAVTAAESRFKASKSWNKECDGTFMKRVYKELRNMGYDVSSTGSLSSSNVSVGRVASRMPLPKSASSSSSNTKLLREMLFGNKKRFVNRRH
jgi:hypothetical protein